MGMRSRKIQKYHRRERKNRARRDEPIDKAKVFGWVASVLGKKALVPLLRRRAA